jgi:hypothetical protein
MAAERKKAATAATDRSRELASLRRKGKKINGGVNPATKLPHTETFLRKRA